MPLNDTEMKNAINITFMATNRSNLEGSFIGSSKEILDNLQLDSNTRQVLRRLQEQGFDRTDLSSYLPKHLAAVLVLLYSHAGTLRVLLTTRSKSLRSHPGETALPGGRVDEDDRDAIETAFREANEEINLPYPSSLSSLEGADSSAAESVHTPHIHTLCVLSPHFAPWGMVVTPVIAYLSHSQHASPIEFLQSTLRANPDEVHRIFTHPLEALLDPELLASPEDEVNSQPEKIEAAPNLSPADHEFIAGSAIPAGEADEVAPGKLNLKAVKLAEKGSEDWPYNEEHYNFTDYPFPRPDNPDALLRLHRFRSTASPITGLTANILMNVATLAYGKPPVPPIEMYAPGQARGYGAQVI